jgi:pyruvate dehydrogenase E1 component
MPFPIALRVPGEGIAARILADQDSAEMRAAIDALTVNQLATAIRDLGGHDLGLLTDTFDRVDEYRPTVVFAYTVKGRGLATEGHPNNHSALLTEDQLRALAEGSGVSVDDPWATFAPGTAEATLCRTRATVLRRPTVAADLTCRCRARSGIRTASRSPPRPRSAGCWPTSSVTPPKRRPGW